MLRSAADRIYAYLINNATGKAVSVKPVSSTAGSSFGTYSFGTADKRENEHQLYRCAERRT